MGQKEVKPNPPAETPAKAASDLAYEGLLSSANEFILQCASGRQTAFTLGYKLVDDKLDAQEIHLTSQSEANVPNDAIEKAVDALFSSDWKQLTKLCVGQLASFFATTPQPQDRAMNEVFGKTYLTYEHGNILMYAVYVKKTNSSSMGTLVGGTLATLMCVACRGIVDYASMDAQTIVLHVRESSKSLDKELTEEQEMQIYERVKRSLSAALEIAQLKKRILAEASGVESKSDVVVRRTAALHTAIQPPLMMEPSFDDGTAGPHTRENQPHDGEVALLQKRLEEVNERLHAGHEAKRRRL